MTPLELFMYGVAIALSLFFISIPILFVYDQIVTQRRVQRAIDKALENDISPADMVEKMDKAKARVKK